MPMIRRLYPNDWEKISEQVKWAARYRCRLCGKLCRKPGESFDTHERTMTTAHINHKPWDCRRENMIALCAPCHLAFDASDNQKKRWFRIKIEGGLGHIGLQLHLFISSLKIGKAIHEHQRELRPAIPGDGDSVRQVRDDLVRPE